MKNKAPQDTLLPQSFITFIIEHLDLFQARVVGDSIVVDMKPAAEGQRRPTLTSVPAPPRIIQYRYKAAEQTLTPELAKRYGFSDQRLKVYTAIYNAPLGIVSKEILTQTGLPHGTVSQILNWLREREMVVAEPLA